ncbi:hypothetical protein FRC19_006983 [Serendipita sp. 401]|nr:hypothetical protein FRC19_006983 [Serendipita sp. 401]
MAAASSTTPPIASSPTSTSVLDTVISSLNGTTVVFTSDNGIATTTSASAATTTATPAIDSKPAERFLIGVLLGLFTILAICFVFLIRPLVLRTWRRLRNQQAVVDQIIDGQRKVLRMRKPRLFEIWIDPRRLIAPEGLESIFRSPMEAQKWDSQKVGSNSMPLFSDNILLMGPRSLSTWYWSTPKKALSHQLMPNTPWSNHDVIQRLFIQTYPIVKRNHQVLLLLTLFCLMLRAPTNH